MSKAAGSTLVVRELISELPHGGTRGHNFPVTVVTDDGETCDVTEAEVSGGLVVLTIDHDCSANPAHDLLWEIHQGKFTKKEIAEKINSYIEGCGHELG